MIGATGRSVTRRRVPRVTERGHDTVTADAQRELREAYASALSARARHPATPDEWRAGLAAASVLIQDGEL